MIKNSLVILLLLILSCSSQRQVYSFNTSGDKSPCSSKKRIEPTTTKNILIKAAQVILETTSDTGGVDLNFLLSGDIEKISHLFFFYDLTCLENNTENKNSSFCLYDNHVYHFADRRYKFSNSNILIILNEETFFFKNLTCPNSEDKIKDVLRFIQANRKDLGNIDLNKVRKFRTYGAYQATSFTHPNYYRSKLPDCSLN